LKNQHESPAIKREAVLALTKAYTTKAEGLDGIETALRGKFRDHPEVVQTIGAVQNIYRTYYFPGMKTDWSVSPNNIGHKDSAGCFRCHDDEHKTADGKGIISGKNCNACHTILGEARATEVSQLDGRGLKFEHPGGRLGRLTLLRLPQREDRR
jgi:hypothetical protein